MTTRLVSVGLSYSSSLDCTQRAGRLGPAGCAAHIGQKEARQLPHPGCGPGCVSYNHGQVGTRALSFPRAACLCGVRSWVASVHCMRARWQRTCAEMYLRARRRCSRFRAFLIADDGVILTELSLLGESYTDSRETSSRSCGDGRKRRTSRRRLSSSRRSRRCVRKPHHARPR